MHVITNSVFTLHMLHNTWNILRPSVNSPFPNFAKLSDAQDSLPNLQVAFWNLPVFPPQVIVNLWQIHILAQLKHARDETILFLKENIFNAFQTKNLLQETLSYILNMLLIIYFEYYFLNNKNCGFKDEIIINDILL